MLRKRPPLYAIVVIVVAIAVGLALLQMTRHRLHADSVTACTSAPAHVEPSRASASAADSSRVVLRLDFAGAEALISALERDSLSDADVDSLLRIRGLCAMVDNVPRYFPGIGVAEFRKDIQTFVRTRKGGKYDGYFQLTGVWQARSTIRSLIASLQANERSIVARTLSELERYRPDTGRLAVTAYFVAGGVSDGFAFENDPTSLYANLARAGGDLNGVVLNMAHEAYHVMQFRAQERVGVVLLSAAADTTTPVTRLFATTLSEGSANYVADPTRWPAAGASMDSARQRYRRHAEPKQMAKNFALFDAVLGKLRTRRMTWEKAYREGFTSENDAAFYFVGHEMTRALEQYCGRECIGRLFAEPPVEFFRRYVALYRRHPELTGRFSQATEAFVSAYGTKTTR